MLHFNQILMLIQKDKSMKARPIELKQICANALTLATATFPEANTRGLGEIYFARF